MKANLNKESLRIKAFQESHPLEWTRYENRELATGHRYSDNVPKTILSNSHAGRIAYNPRPIASLKGKKERKFKNE